MRRITLPIAAILAVLLGTSLATADRRRGIENAQRYYYSPSTPAEADGFSAHANLVANWRATDEVYTDLLKTDPAADTEAVRVVNDLSGNNYHVSLDATTHTRTAGGSNGLTQSHIDNNGAALTLTSGDTSVLNFGSSDARTVFARFSLEDVTTTNGVLGKVTGGIGWFVYNYHSGGVPKTTFGITSTGAYIYGVYAGSWANDTACEVWYRYTGSGAASGIKIRFNRAEVTEDAQTSGTLGTSTTAAAFKLEIQENGSAAPGINWEEIAIFNADVSLTDIQAYEAGYLLDQYGAM